MKTRLAVVALLWCCSFIATSANAQLNKCISPAGKVEYRQGMCEGAAKQGRMTGGTVSTVDAMPEHEIQRLLAPERIYSSGGVGGYQASQQGRRVPSEIDIRNMETSANSLGLSERERLMRRAEIAAARNLRAGGSGQLDTSALQAHDARRAERRRQAAAAAAASAAENHHPTITRMKSCNGGSCFDSQGTRYREAGGNRMVRQDGTSCRQSGGRLICN
ncbi:hypothetical protein [Hydrogenophaga atypica]|uniref:DUF4124 domain-containing protein n=1 Tax=Hydrogenophaga atypica TaxID=249409 RepID=A0ABW2QND6_9BURK